MASPLYHTNGFVLGLSALVCGDQVVLMARFDPALVLDLIERYRIDAATMVPTMLGRIVRVPGVTERDLSSLSYVRAGGGPCPPWLARTWIDLVGPDRFLIGYGASERIGGTTITGRQWLDHPGSVGRPVGVSVRIVGDDGRDRPTGEVGDIYMRAADEARWPPFEYRGAQSASVTDDGFIGVGDVGWLDDDGYLYIADRRTDLIVSGGANVYPAEVEAALGEHPQVADVVVIGLPDPEWGQRVHAVVQPADPDHPAGARGPRRLLPGPAGRVQDPQDVGVAPCPAPHRSRQDQPPGTPPGQLRFSPTRPFPPAGSQRLGPGNVVAGHSVERDAVYRPEQLPVEKARYATGTERGYLVKGTLTGAVPQPGVTGEPSDAPQHQLARPDPGDAPPVDERSRHHGRGPASSKAFAYEAPEDKAGHPPGRSAVPAEPPADRLQIANDHSSAPGGMATSTTTE